MDLLAQAIYLGDVVYESEEEQQRKKPKSSIVTPVPLRFTPKSILPSSTTKELPKTTITSKTKSKKVKSQGKKRRNRRTFTESEDERLMEAVQTKLRDDGSVNWREVAKAVNPNLNLKQCLQHYKRVLLHKKDHVWSDNDMLELYHYVQLHGDRKMAFISDDYYDSYYPDNQIRYIYKHKIADNAQIIKMYNNMSSDEIHKIIEANRLARNMTKTCAPAIKSKFRSRRPQSATWKEETDSTEGSCDEKIIITRSMKLGKRSRELRGVEEEPAAKTFLSSRTLEPNVPPDDDSSCLSFSEMNRL
jgi:hypothetical protein